MKEYSVVYLTEGEEELIALWEKSPDRNLVADAANLADQILGVAPRSRSVYLGEDLWRLEVKPLRFYFAIREEDRIVEVAKVIECDPWLLWSSVSTNLRSKPKTRSSGPRGMLHNGAHQIEFFLPFGNAAHEV
jgi:hypothetical protein